MRQTERISNSSRSSSFNFKSFEWSAILLLLTIAPSLTLTQYASSAYSSQFYGNNHQQVQQQQQLQQQLQPRRYPDTPLTYTYQYPAADVQSVWSSAPIVVNDEANSLELARQQQQRQQRQQEQSYLPINYYNNRELDRRQTNWIHNNKDDYYVPTTRAANHNYNNVPGYFYYPQTQTQPQSQQELEQRELLSAADSRRDEEQIVRIGGIQSLALNPQPNNNNNNAYYEPSQPWRRNNLDAQYAQHYSDYLRKYPQRLQPLYNTDK